MEQHLLVDILRSLEGSPSSETLASARSLVCMPSTSQSTVSGLLEAISRFLRLPENQHHQLLSHLLTVLSDIAHRFTELSPHVFTCVSSFPLFNGKNPRLAAQSLSLLASIADRDGTQDPVFDKVSESLFLSLCFSPSASVRPWLLSNAERFRVRGSLLVTTFLGFTSDPFPYVRRSALNGLAILGNRVGFEDRRLVEGCYRGTVDMLSDSEDCVRLAAIKGVTVWGLKFVESQPDSSKADLYDVLFIQLCSMARDMSMEVRAATFEAISRLGRVSDDLLLQALSKRMLKNTKERKFLDQNLKKNMLSIHGAFLHGTEDEFYQVRRSACFSMQCLSSFSKKFCEEGLSLVVDVLNDYHVDVRSQALSTLQCMASCHPLKLQNAEMHMIMATLMDERAEIRVAGREVLKSLKIPTFNIFKSCIYSLLENLKQFPQDEADVTSALLSFGSSHEKFAISIIRDHLPEMEPRERGEMYADITRTSALMSLAMSVPSSDPLHPTIASRARPFRMRDGNWRADPTLDELNAILNSISLAWPHHGARARNLRAHTQRLESMTAASGPRDPSLAFTLRYVRAVRLLATLLLGRLDCLHVLDRLDGALTELLCLFTGTEDGDRLHILEFAMLACLWRRAGDLHGDASETRLSAVAAVLPPGHTGPGDLRRFAVRRFVLRGDLGWRVRADAFHVTGHDPADPFRFVPGLPSAVPLDIRLHAAVPDPRVWLGMRVNGGAAAVQFIFLDPDRWRNRPMKLVAPFYSTPDCSHFRLAVSVSVESVIFPRPSAVASSTGPSSELCLLSDEKQVDFRCS